MHTVSQSESKRNQTQSKNNKHNSYDARYVITKMSNTRNDRGHRHSTKQNKTDRQNKTYTTQIATRMHSYIHVSLVYPSRTTRGRDLAAAAKRCVW
mmetsp:Transcript_2930/g.4874  ORF Transcript_2930/g.4874 Transcript_2930/m.4874 type:complete len:96 (-) Transcript_2930:1347-1634(-)